MIFSHLLLLSPVCNHSVILQWFSQRGSDTIAAKSGCLRLLVSWGCTFDENAPFAITSFNKGRERGGGGFFRITEHVRNKNNFKIIYFTSGN